MPTLGRKSLTGSASVDVKHQFKLFAVVMHSGVSLNSGHYTAFVNYAIVTSQQDEYTDTFGNCLYIYYFLTIISYYSSIA